VSWWRWQTRDDPTTNIELGAKIV